MAAVGAVRIGERIGYFAIVNGRNWTRIYMEDDEGDAFLKAIAEAGWQEYTDYLERIHKLDEQRRQEWFKKLLFYSHIGFGLLAIPRFESGLDYSISDAEGSQVEEILYESPHKAYHAFVNRNFPQP